MNPKELLSKETVEKKISFVEKMKEKLGEITGISEAKDFGQLMERTIDRAFYLLPVAFAGGALTSYSKTLGIDDQQVTQTVGYVLQSASLGIIALGTVLDVVGASSNKIREDEKELNREPQAFDMASLNKARVLSRMVAMSDNDPDPVAKERANKLK